MLLFNLLMIFIVTFILVCFAFTYYHQNCAYLQRQQNGAAVLSRRSYLKYLCLKSIECLWLICLHWLRSVDRFIVHWAAYLAADYLHADQYANGLAHYLNDTCSRTGRPEHNDDTEELQSIRREIDELANAICELYIDFWYQNVVLQDDDDTNDELRDRANFKLYCRRTIEEALFNFYKFCTEKVDGKRLRLEFIDEIESHILSQSASTQKGNTKRLRTKDEITLLLNLIDDIFKQALPSDVNALLTNCDCCKLNGAKKNCLQQSSNPVRLFIYNLVIYSLLLPLIDRFTHPLYYLYNCISLGATLGGLSMKDFISLYETSAEDCFFDGRQFESQPVPLAVEPEDKTHEKALLYEAIEESKKELMIFSKIQISNVKISSNEMMISTISKMNPYIDYIIVYNVLECDREIERQRNSKQRNENNNKQTFLQRTYQVKRRFREFLSFQQKLEKNPDFRLIMNKIQNKPSHFQFHSSTFLNYIKSTKITENSPLVKLRRDCLESFLNQLARYKCINESKEFCEFLGYKYKCLYEVKMLLNNNLITERNEPNQSSKANSKNYDLNFKNLKDVFKIFLPLQAKYGQLSTQIEDVMVNEQVCNKYSIMKIDTDQSDHNHMVLQLKLDKWTNSNSNPSKSGSKQFNSQANMPNCDENSDKFKQKLISCLFLLLFKSYFVFQNYFVNRISYFLKFVLAKVGNILTFHSIFRYYLHYLHTFLTGMETIDPMEGYAVSYDRFYRLFKDKDRKQLFARYVQCSEQRVMQQCKDNKQNGGSNGSSSTCRTYLLRAAFYLCDEYRLFHNIVTSFDSQQDNKLLIYSLIHILCNQIKSHLK